MCQAVPSDPPADRRDEHCSSAHARGESVLRGAYPPGPRKLGQPPLGKRAFGRAIRESPLRRGSGRSDQGIAPYAAAGSECHPEEAKPTKDLAPGGSKRFWLTRQNQPGAVGILR